MRIHIIDDDAGSLRLLDRVLTGAGHETTCFVTPDDLIAALDTLPYGCMLLDINMPGVNGLDLLNDLLARDPAWPVVMVSGSTEVDDAILAFRRGAIHFLRKPFHNDELLRVLGEVEQIAEARLADHLRRCRAIRIHLTARELQVLSAMADGQQSKVIAWTLGLSVRTVEMHRSHILTKMSSRTSSQAVAMARELGLINSKVA